jgi:hypothetical protein
MFREGEQGTWKSVKCLAIDDETRFVGRWWICSRQGAAARPTLQLANLWELLEQWERMLMEED